MEFSKALDKLGDTALTRDDEEDDIGAAFQKFAVVTKELSALMKNMVSFFMIWMWISIYLFLCEVNAACSWPSIVHHQAIATRKIVTRRDASIEKINKIWAVHFRP